MDPLAAGFDSGRWRMALRWFKERDQARKAGDQLAKVLLEQLPFLSGIPAVIIRDAVPAYAQAEGWNGPAGSLVVPSDNGASSVFNGAKRKVKGR